MIDETKRAKASTVGIDRVRDTVSRVCSEHRISVAKRADLANDLARELSLCVDDEVQAIVSQSPGFMFSL